MWLYFSDFTSSTNIKGNCYVSYNITIFIVHIHNIPIISIVNIAKILFCIKGFIVCKC